MNPVKGQVKGHVKSQVKILAGLVVSAALALTLVFFSEPAAAQQRKAAAPAATPPSSQRPTLQQGIPVYESSAPTAPKPSTQTAPGTAPGQRRQLMPLDQLRAGNYTVQTLDGQHLQIAELLNTDKPVVIEFWQMSCELSQSEIRFLNAAWERYERRGLTLLALTIDDPAQRQTVRSFVRSMHMSYPVYFTSPSLYKLMMGGASGTPQTFVFDRNGRIHRRFVGWDVKRGSELESGILAAFEGRP